MYKSAQVSLLPDCVNIGGEYYTVSSGFVSQKQGQIQLKYKDLLSAELVKQRSKKTLYAALLPGAILVFVFGLGDIAYMALLMPLLIVAALAMCALGVGHMLSAQHFLEITSMQGTFRIAVEQQDSSMERLVAQLRERIYTK